MRVLGYKLHSAIHVEASDCCPWNCTTQMFSVTNTFGDISYLNTVGWVSLWENISASTYDATKKIMFPFSQLKRLISCALENSIPAHSYFYLWEGEQTHSSLSSGMTFFNDNVDSYSIGQSRSS